MDTSVPAPFASVERLFLYDDPEALGLDLEAFAEILPVYLPGLRVETRRDFLTHHLARFEGDQREALAEQLLGQLSRAHLREADEHLLDAYDAPSLQAILHLLLPEDENRLSDLHFAFMGWSLVTPASAGELHTIPAVFGEPNLMSLPSLLETPVADREYKFLRVHMAMMGVEEGMADLDTRFSDQLLQEGDPRLGAICLGFILQALFYRLFGEAFCSETTCRLHDSPSHEALLAAHAQPDSSLCPVHRAWLASLRPPPAPEPLS